jgi:flagellar hook assembly protein FlgD
MGDGSLGAVEASSIPFQLAESADVIISIYDVHGQLVRKMRLGKIPTGAYVSRDKAAYWDGRNDAGERVASGIYFYNLRAGDYSVTKRMLILK